VAADHLLTRPFLLCFAANLLQGLAFNLFLHFPRFLHELGADDVEIGFVTSLTAIAAIALRPPIGRAMDRGGRRRVILAGGALNAFVVSLYFGVERIGPWLYAVRIGHGLAEAMLFSSLFTYAADHVPARMRTQGLALFGVSGMLPIALGGVLGDVLLGAGHAGWLFGASLALAVVSLLLSLPLPESPQPDGAPDPASLGLRAALVQRDLLPLWWLGTVFSTSLTAFFVFTRRFVDETGIGSVGLFFSAYTAAAILLRVGFGWVPDRVGARRALAPSLACLVAGFAWMARAGDAFDLAAAGVLCGVGHGATFPILFGLVVTRAPERNRGMVMAVYTALFDIGVLVGGPSLGWLIEHAGFAAMFGAAGLLLAAGTGVFFAWDARTGP
jgi:MFS family permease